MDIREQIDAGLLNALPIPVAVFDRTSRLIAFSPAYAAFSTLSDDFLASRPTWSDLIARLHAAHRLPEVANLPAWRDEERHRLGGLTRTIEERHYLPDGSTYKRTVTPLRGGGFVLAYEDLSPRIAAERAVNEAALVQRMTLDHLSDALAVFGPDGRFKFANAAFRLLWTWEGDKLSEFLAASGSDWTQAHLLARRSGTTRIERSGSLYGAHHLPLPDGAVLLRYVDVTLDARLQDALRDQAAASAAADRMKSEFVATLAHEARVPLTTIAGFAQMLSGGYAGALSARQMDYAGNIANTTRQLACMIDDILDLAEIEAGTVELDSMSFDIHTTLASLIIATAERTRTKRLTMTFDCAPTIGSMRGDPRRIRQAVLHLLNNAIQYTQPGGTVTLAAKRTKTSIEIDVVDTGIGIPRDELSSVQQPFMRGSEAGKLGPGSGLGLTLVRGIVDLHGGELQISSLRHRGTTVTMRLPLPAAFSMEKSDADG